MAVTWADVVAIEPAAALVTSTTAQQIFLTTAAEMVDPDLWGATYDRGVLYFTAHLGLLSSWGAVASGGGSAGPVTSETLGPMSRSYANLFTSSADTGVLGSTKWGQIYLLLLGTQVGMFVP